MPGVPFTGITTEGSERPDPDEGSYGTTGDDVPTASGRDKMYHPYLVTIDPDLTFKSGHENQARNVEIRVKKFNDLVIPPNGVGASDELFFGCKSVPVGSPDKYRGYYCGHL